MHVAVEPIPYGALASEVRDRMSASVAGEKGLGVGLEVELIPVRADTWLRVPLWDGPEGPGSASLLRTAAGCPGWCLAEPPGATPHAEVVGIGHVTFEPGGQLELSTRPFAGLDALAAAVEAGLRPLHEAAERLGVLLIGRGIDPMNPGETASLQVGSERYRKQAAHYASIGPWGRRMMLQSAAIHVNVDLGGRAGRRWSVANRVAPLLTAMFANSPRYEGREAGVRSFRAEQWRHLDPTRTGLPFSAEDAVAAYTAFALAAGNFLGAHEGGPVRPFRSSWESGAGLDAWRAHLTTVFPEVRPRGYLEVRSADALRPVWAIVPALVVAGLLYDAESLAEAHRLLPMPTDEALWRAGRDGMGDPAIRAAAAEVFDLGLAGARRLGSGFSSGGVLERAEEFKRRFVDRALDPGSEPDGLDPFEP